jgi:hypothetical protein
MKLEKDEGLNNENLKPDLKSKIKEELEKSNREQQILLKDNNQTIINFLVDNKESIKVEDLKSYEPIYKCYREKGNCIICNTVTNIISISYNNYNNNEVWLCVYHWKQHRTDNH